MNGLPGVSSTYFGPNAARPVIRGLDADRVRLMLNGLGMLDVSALSPDHAVPLDSLVINQVEVVRGPAALLYGGGAVVGVVNALDNRIPQEPISGSTGRAKPVSVAPTTSAASAPCLKASMACSPCMRMFSSALPTI